MYSSTAKAALERRKDSSRKSFSDASVVHAVPGRMRLRVRVLRWEPDLAGSLKAFLQAQPGIIDADVNVWAYSVTVNCDPSCWPADVLCAFLQQDLPIDVLESTGVRHISCWNHLVCFTDGTGWIAFPRFFDPLLFQSSRGPSDAVSTVDWAVVLIRLSPEFFSPR